MTEGLRYNGSIKHLHLERNKIGAKGISSIAFAFQQRISIIETLNISFFSSPLSASLGFFPSLVVECQLHSLPFDSLLSITLRLSPLYCLLLLFLLSVFSDGANISNNEITWKGCQEISSLINKSTTITKIDLSFNEIGERGVELIAGTSLGIFLLVCPCFFFSHPDLHLIGIAETLKWNKTLTYLDISSNRILDQGGKAVASMLAVNTYVPIILCNSSLLFIYLSIYLSFSFYFLSFSPPSLGSKFDCHRSIQHLNVRDNGMKDAAGTAFAQHLRGNDRLLTINVDMNDFNFQNFSAITEKLKENKKKFKRALISRHKKSIEELKV